MLALFLAFYLTPFFCRLAFAIYFLDKPDGACKQHKAPVAYLGGVVVFISFFIPLIALQSSSIMPLWGCMCGVFFLLLVGLFDDYSPTKPHQKLAGQLVAVLFLLKAGYHLKETFFLSHFISIPLSGLWLLTVINAFNLVDVMDGLAVVLAGCSISFYFALAFYLGIESVMLLSASLLGALCGFLWYNKPRARIYLGDAGSLFLGGMVGVFPFLIPWNSFFSCAFFAPIIITFIPLAEVAGLVVIRTWLGLPIYYGSPHHFCHYLQRKGWGVWPILLFCMAIFSLLACVVFFFLHSWHGASLFLLLCTVVFWIFSIFY